ncbi:hypothetical protein SRHO_G00106550 [Serrasalmus rhombeus]
MKRLMAFSRQLADSRLYYCSLISAYGPGHARQPLRSSPEKTDCNWYPVVACVWVARMTRKEEQSTEHYGVTHVIPGDIITSTRPACALLGGGYGVMASRWELMGCTWACYSASVGSKPDSAKYTHHKLFPLRSAPWAGQCHSQAAARSARRQMAALNFGLFTVPVHRAKHKEMLFA